MATRMPSDPTGVTPPSADDPTIGRLVADATRDISTLVSKEIALAKSELKVSVRAGGLGIALLAAAGFVAVLAVIMLSIAIAYFISLLVGPHWAFLIVFAAYLLVAGLLAFVGVKKLKKVGPPERAIEQGREIPRALTGKA